MHTAQVDLPRGWQQRPGPPAGLMSTFLALQLAAIGQSALKHILHNAPANLADVILADLVVTIAHAVLAAISRTAIVADIAAGLCVGAARQGRAVVRHGF